MDKLEIVKALDALAKLGVLFGGTRLRRRMVIEVRMSPTYIVVKYDDGGIQYIDRRRYLAVHLPRLVKRDAAESLNTLAKLGVLYADNVRIVAVQRVGRRLEIVTEDGRKIPHTRLRQLVVQISP